MMNNSPLDESNKSKEEESGSACSDVGVSLDITFQKSLLGFVVV